MKISLSSPKSSGGGSRSSRSSSSSISNNSITFRVTPCTTTTPSPNHQHENFLLLGGLSPPARVFDGHGDSTPYAALPRPRKLPPPTFPLEINNKGIEALYNKIWNGNFMATCELDAQGRTLIITGSCAAIDEDDDHDDDAYGIPAELRGPGVIRVEFMRFNSECFVLSQHVGFHNQEFGSALTETCKIALCYRMLHHVVRTHGASLPGGYDMAMSACKALIAVYTADRKGDVPTNLKTKFFEQALDVAIVMADLAVNFGDADHMIGYYLKTVGGHLECVEKYSQAAEIYVYAADHYYSKSIADDYRQRPDCYLAAGLACRRDGQLQKSEENYIAALHYASRSSPCGFDFNHPVTKNTFNNLLILCEMIDVELFCSEARRRDAVYSALQALLCMAGFKKDDKVGERNIPNLHPAYQNSQKATLALDLATRKPDRQHFRKTILKYWNPRQNGVVTQASYPSYMNIYGKVDKNAKRMLQERNTAEKLESLEAARNSVTERCRSFRKCRCSNPSCTEVLTVAVKMGCPCQSMYYCSESCQGVHWKDHKKVCPWRNRGKENAHCKNVPVAVQGV